MSTFIEARVIQKVDTEANWMANPLKLYQGEVAYVSDKYNFKLNTTEIPKTFAELEYYYKGDILGGVKTTDNLASKPDGVYRAVTSGNYSGVVVKEGYYTLLRKDGGIWSLESEVRVDSGQVDQEFNIESENAISNKAVTPLATALDGFIDGSITDEVLYLDKTFENFSINGVNSTYKSNGISRLTNKNTILNYDDANLESYIWLDVPTKIGSERISKIDISLLRVGGNGTENPKPINMLGIKSNGEKTIIIDQSTPFSGVISKHIIDLTQYDSFSLMIMNEKSTNNGKNGTIVKLYKATKSTTNVKEYIDNQGGLGTNNRINVMSRGAKTDGVTDNTSIINQCIIELLNKGGGTLFFPAGNYKVSEINIPNFNAWQAITLEGEFIPAPRFGTIVVPGVYDPDVTKPNGSVIISTSTNSSKGIVYCNQGNSYQNFNLGILIMNNLTIRSYNNPNITAIHAENMAQLHLENVIVDTGVYNVKASLPSNDVSGVITPKNSNCAYTILNNVCVSGYKYGIQVNEHFNGDMLNIQSCVNALVFNSADHSALIKRACLQRNTNQIKINGSHIFKIEAMNCEYAGAGQTDSNNAWQATQYELYDPSNLGIGEIKYANVKGNVGKVNTFRINGANNVIVKKIGSETRLTGNGIPD